MKTSFHKLDGDHANRRNFSKHKTFHMRLVRQKREKPLQVSSGAGRDHLVLLTSVLLQF